MMIRPMRLVWLGTGCFGHVSRGIIHIRKYHLWRVLDFEALVRDVRVPGVPVSEWTSKARFNQIQGHPPVVLPGVTRNPHQDFDSNTEISCARKRVNHPGDARALRKYGSHQPRIKIQASPEVILRIMLKTPEIWDDFPL